jgi:hypothetical protein
VHDIFSPDTIFTPQSGTWGLQGIVRIPNRFKDYIFLVTFNQSAVNYQFDENITESGILTWQSQPSQSLNEARILDFINHDHNKNNIYLFLRTNKKNKYTYLGKLAYLTHDTTREKPVHFKWQILDWDYTDDLLSRIQLTLVDDNPDFVGNKSQLIKSNPPEIENGKLRRKRNFQGRNIDFAENEAKNKKVGIGGEETVIKYEVNYLLSNGKPDLAEKVIHISKVIGDGTGYDILSYDLDGNKKYIEVKTTRGGQATPFYISASEYEFAELNSKNYFLYRLYNFSEKKECGYFYQFRFEDIKKLRKEPINFKVFPNHEL